VYAFSRLWLSRLWLSRTSTVVWFGTSYRSFYNLSQLCVCDSAAKVVNLEVAAGTTLPYDMIKKSLEEHKPAVLFLCQASPLHKTLAPILPSIIPEIDLLRSTNPPPSSPARSGYVGTPPDQHPSSPSLTRGQHDVLFPRQMTPLLSRMTTFLFGMNQHHPTAPNLRQGQAPPPPSPPQTQDHQIYTLIRFCYCVKSCQASKCQKYRQQHQPGRLAQLVRAWC
jgi:hypothetical protein